MTLNVTVVSTFGIHQSADFRISKTEKDTNGNWIELQPNSSKIVPLRYQKWFGFMSYCGIGLWNGKRTDEYAVEWLADLAPTNPSFRDVVDKIRLSGSNWVTGINRGRKEPFSHSFVIAGFEDAVPIYAIVSNAQSLTEYFSISEQLIADVRATKDIHLLITGISAAVSEPARARLKAIVRSMAPANVIRHEMAEVNRIASQSPEARNGISPACLAYSVDSNGAGHGEVHGEVPGPVIPRTVLDGIDVTAMMAKILKDIPGAKLVQAAYTTMQASHADREEHIECELEFRGIDSCDIEEIGAINEY